MESERGRKDRTTKTRIWGGRNGGSLGKPTPLPSPQSCNKGVGASVGGRRLLLPLLTVCLVAAAAATAAVLSYPLTLL